MTASFSGGCLCGACRYSAQGEPINVRVCHCRLCQKALGATFNARVLMPREAVELGGPVGWSHSSPELARGFCTLCGSTLFSERASRAWIGITLASLDEPDRFAPTEHIWTSGKPAWLQLADGLPQYPEGPPG